LRDSQRPYHHPLWIRVRVRFRVDLEFLSFRKAIDKSAKV